MYVCYILSMVVHVVAQSARASIVVIRQFSVAHYVMFVSTAGRVLLLVH